MDIFLSKDEKLQKLEKRINDLEKKIDRNFVQMNGSFETFRKVVQSMQRENAEIKKDRDFLLEKYKEVLRKMNIPFAEPVRGAISDASNLLKDVVLEDLDIEPKSRNIDDLFELVMKRKKITARTAAKELDVREDRVRYWASKLQKKGLIELRQNLNRAELIKK